MKKSDYRKIYLNKRKELSLVQKKNAEDRIWQRVYQSSYYQNAQNIFCYVSMPGELDTHSFIEQAIRDYKKIIIPRVEKSRHLSLYEFSNWDRLELSQFGILEPSSQNDRVSANEVELVITPALAVNSQGYRLGYGGGYYDYFFQAHPDCSRIIPIFSCCIDETIPVDSWDQPVNWIVSETQTIVIK